MLRTSSASVTWARLLLLTLVSGPRKPPRLYRMVAATLLLGLLGTACADTPETTEGPTAPTLSVVGLGRLKIGIRLEDAQKSRLVGKDRPGCELAGPGERIAPLIGSAQGFAYFFDGILQAISITSGATTPEGISVGATVADVQRTYGQRFRVAVDVDSVFEAIFVRVERQNRPIYGMTANLETNRIESLSVDPPGPDVRVNIPAPSTCATLLRISANGEELSRVMDRHPIIRRPFSS